MTITTRALALLLVAMLAACSQAVPVGTNVTPAEIDPDAGNIDDAYGVEMP